MKQFNFFYYSCPAIVKIFPFCAKIHAFEDTTPIYHIRVKPNIDNQILIPDLNSQEENSDSEDNLKPLRCLTNLSCSNRCARMDAKIIKLAFQVLDKKANEKHDENEKEKFNKRIDRMETTLDKIEEKLTNLLTLNK